MAEWLKGKGEMAELIRTTDWTHTPLGPHSTWPQTLRTTLNLILASQIPTAILWGRDLLLLYNDAYRVGAAERHPSALGRSTREIWSEVWHINQPIFEAVMSRGETIYLENQLFPITRHGTLEQAYFTLCYSPIYNRNGSVSGSLVTLLETTLQVRERTRTLAELKETNARLETELVERNQSEVALRDSETRFRALVEASSEVLYRMNHDWTEMRQLQSRNFLVSTESPSRTWLQTYIPPDDQRYVQAVIDDAIRNKKVFELQHRVLRADGSLGWVAARAIPQFDADGEIVEWFGAASDITARKRAEEALRASEARLRATLQSIPDEVWIVDAKDRVVMVSEAVRLHLGVAPDHWPDIYQALSDLERFDPFGTPLPKEQAPLPSALRGEVRTGQREVVRKLATGELRWREVTSGPIRDEKNRIIPGPPYLSSIRQNPRRSR